MFLFLLRRKLKSKDSNIRWEAVRRLALSPHAESSSLLAGMLNDPDKEIVRVTAETLIGRNWGKTRDERCQLAMLAGRYEAAVEHSPTVALPLLLDEIGRLRGDYFIRALRALGAIKCESTLAVMARELKNPSVKVREVALESIIGFGKEELGSLTPALYDCESKIKNRVAEVFGESGDERLVAPLIEALEKGGEHSADFYLVRALGRLGCEEAVQPLARKVRCHPTAIAEAVSKIGGITAVKYLLEWMSNPDIGNSNQRESIAEYLARTPGSEAAIDSLLALLSKSPTSLSENSHLAARCLGRMKVKEAVTLYLTLIADKYFDTFWIQTLRAFCDGQAAASLFRASIRQGGSLFVTALKEVLEGDASGIDLETLTEMARMDDIKESYDARTSADDEWLGPDWRERALDCKQLRALASAELKRRGFSH